MQTTPDANPWRHMLDELERVRTNPGADKGRRDTAEADKRRLRKIWYASAKSKYVPSLSLSVELIEQSSPSTVVLVWNDTECRYGYQTWKLSSARKSGICALSGACIIRGDLVYKPLAHPLPPLNAHLMILKTVLDERRPLGNGSLFNPGEF